MKEINEKKICNLAPLIATIFRSLCERNLSEYDNVSDLKENVAKELGFAFKVIPTLLWDMNRHSLLLDLTDDLSAVNKAFKPYVEEADNYTKHNTRLSLFESVNIAANYMVLSFLADYYPNLLNTLNDPSEFDTSGSATLKEWAIERMAFAIADRPRDLLSNEAPVKGKLVINKYEATFDDIRDCLTDGAFNRIVEESQYQDTGGGWRSTYRTLNGLVGQYIDAQGKKPIKSEHPYPLIEVLPCDA
tara:strand:+ start:6982 stop:7719 length:738 start_codon:yes stop_codon:yes gene_type:complete